MNQYEMVDGEIVEQLTTQKSFYDNDSCDLDLIKIDKPTTTVNRKHFRCTEVFLWLDGKGSIFLEEEKLELSESNRFLIIHKGMRHRLEVSEKLHFYTVCLPYYDKKDENE